MKNLDKKILAEAFSEEHLKKLLESNDPRTKAHAEVFLNVCKYDEDYWEMPDYYYPGLHLEDNFLDNEMAVSLLKQGIPSLADIKSSTANDRVLYRCGLAKTEPMSSEFYFETNPDSHIVLDKESEDIVFLEKGEIKCRIPWPIFCGLFLKARELKFSKPDCLNEAEKIGFKRLLKKED